MVHVSAALAQTPEIPSVGVQPIGTTSDDPNSGQWFIGSALPGKSITMTARITNPADVEQTVRLYFADLDFARDGTPSIADRSDDIGTWGKFDSERLTLAPRANVQVPFTIAAPPNAEPGDHVGVVIAETQPQGNAQIKVLKRVATRLYVTIPGDAQADFRIEDVTLEKDSSLYTKEVTLTIELRNTGRVRLTPEVFVGGTKASGPDLLLTKSVEQYVVTKSVPIWGGPQNFRVDVRSTYGISPNTRSGPARQARVSTLVIPWVLVAAMVALGLLVLGLRRWVRRRTGRYASLQADMRRIERLLQEQREGARAEENADDPAIAIKSALKQARRAGDDRTAERLEEKLQEFNAVNRVLEAQHDQGGDTLDAILRELPTAPVKRQTALIRAAQAYGPKELARREELIAALPAGLRAAVTGPASEAVGRLEAKVEDVKVRASEVVKRQSPAPTPAPPVEVATPARAPGTTAPAAVSAPSDDDPLAAILREIANAPPHRRDALITAAQTFGPAALGAHDDLVSELPLDVRLTLLRGAFSQPPDEDPTP